MPEHTPGVLDPSGPRRGRGPVRRLLLDNDWAGDPDGIVALAHHLLSSDLVVAVTSSLTSPGFPGSHNGAARGLMLASELAGVVAPAVTPEFAVGSERSLRQGGGQSPASHLIVQEALRDHVLPLTVVCAGPLTNVAAALRYNPEVANRARLVWVGGTSAAGGFEYNRDTDPEAAAEVFASAITIEQFPLETYQTCSVSVAELEAAFAPTTVGRAVWATFTTLEIPEALPVGEVWHLGDSLPLLTTSLSASAEPLAHRRIVHTSADLRLIVGDMLAKFTLHERRISGAA